MNTLKLDYLLCVSRTSQHCYDIETWDRGKYTSLFALCWTLTKNCQRQPKCGSAQLSVFYSTQ